jgi:hypothetical protein
VPAGRLGVPSSSPEHPAILAATSKIAIATVCFMKPSVGEMWLKQ